jgi:hypothetical protein
MYENGSFQLQATPITIAAMHNHNQFKRNKDTETVRKSKDSSTKTPPKKRSFSRFLSFASTGSGLLKKVWNEEWWDVH